MGTSTPSCYGGPYSVGKTPDIVDGKETTKPWRNNDGSMVIRGTDPDGESLGPVLYIPMKGVEPKRGQGWCTTDPEQEAFAAFVADALNKAAQS